MGSKGPALRAVAILGLVLTNITVLLRFYTRFFILRKLALDDYIVLFCQVNFIVFMVVILKQVQHGLGEHLMAIVEHNPEDLVITMKWWFAGQTLFILSTCTIKIAIVYFFFSLRPPRLERILAVFGLVISIIAGLGVGFWQIFQCSPIHYFWSRMDFKDTSGSCFNPYKSYALLMAFTVMDIVSDASLAAVPALMVWNMKLNTIKKAAVCALLGMGILSTIAPVIRLFYLKKLTYETSDFTYTGWGVSFTAVMEPAIAIAAVSIAQLRPLIRKVVPKSWQSGFNAGHQPNSPDAPNDPDRPATFGAGDKRPQRRSFGRSLLESTFGRSRDMATATARGPAETLEIEFAGNGDDNSSSNDAIETKKKSPVHSEYV